MVVDERRTPQLSVLRMVSEPLLCRSGCGANLIQGDESRGVSGGHLRQILHAREASGENLIEDDESQGGVYVTP
ncbi:hypothetical protein E3N88_38794 [Mikania micrantha]|uniref:Uncharacterized protein n=1 Tax=Mikania micrantha TaxID=192012 RepID=A0A5N6LV41_9ASTR|nr:hypothetical protein E3N88_38794 [Mikania micrantha]